MNDIEVLEDLRKELGRYADGKKIKQGQSLENLLKERQSDKERIKELEKENEELLEVRVSASANTRIFELEKENNQLKLKIADLYKSCGEYEKAKSIMTKELREYIPKSLIKEKIEELKNIFDMGEEWYTKEYIIQVLEELLKGE